MDQVNTSLGKGWLFVEGEAEELPSEQGVAMCKGSGTLGSRVEKRVAPAMEFC